MPDYGIATTATSSSVAFSPGFTPITGTAGGDTLAGTLDANVIYGGATTGTTGTGSDAISAGGGNDAVLAGDGGDTVTGGAGADTIHGGAGAASYADSGAGVAVRLDDGTGSGGTAQDDLLNGVENVTGSAHGDTLTGSSAENVIDGGGGNDTICGGKGSATLLGGSGADELLGEGGDDRLVLAAGFGADTITGGETGEGIGDTLDASALGTDTSVVIPGGGSESGSVTSAGTTAGFTGIERIVLGAGNDSVDAAAASGAIVADTGAGNDAITGGGDDRLLGGAGADSVSGGAGNDGIFLGAGDGAADVVALAGGGDADVIHDFAAPTATGGGGLVGHDLLDVSALTDAAGIPVNASDVVVTDTNSDGSGDAVLTFPGGESVTLVGVSPAEIATVPQLHAIGIPCFTRSIRIATTRGPVPIATLGAGDRILTRYSGAQTLRWVGSRHIAAIGSAAPIEIAPGTFGNDRPLRLSAQHRVLLDGWQAELHVGTREVFAAAMHLVDGESVVIRAGGGGWSTFTCSSTGTRSSLPTARRPKASIRATRRSPRSCRGSARRSSR